MLQKVSTFYNQFELHNDPDSPTKFIFKSVSIKLINIATFFLYVFSHETIFNIELILEAFTIILSRIKE